ncbi:MAG: hypothetical protein IJK62_05260 [Bacteroidales bacterium]|nr:hypothetical protein [Bacteroidales bacterium]
MKKCFVFAIVLSLVAISSCRNGDEVVKGEVLTKKILYDVPIVNLLLEDRSENDPNWFWENLPYPVGDKFIDDLYADAKDCNIPIYYYDQEGDYEHLERIPDNKVKEMFENEMTVSLPVPDVFDEEANAYVSRPNVDFKLDQTRILKLRFLEEWHFDNNMITKRVLAVAPVFTINIGGTDAAEGYEYNTVKFWFMADEKLLK